MPPLGSLGRLLKLGGGLGGAAYGAATAEEDESPTLRALGYGALGGALLLDGSIGSHSAALIDPYVDRAGSGQLYRATLALTEFAVQARPRGIQLALHALGDRAVAQAVTLPAPPNYVGPTATPVVAAVAVPPVPAGPSRSDSIPSGRT